MEDIKRETITIEEFSKLDLRIGTIRSTSAIPNADRLYRLTIEVGEEVLTTVAGIKRAYLPEELVGGQVVVLANLEPAKIKGITSECMLLAAKGEKITLLIPDREVPPGTPIG